MSHRSLDVNQIAVINKYLKICDDIFNELREWEQKHPASTRTLTESLDDTGNVKNPPTEAEFREYHDLSRKYDNACGTLHRHLRANWYLDHDRLL